MQMRRWPLGLLFCAALVVGACSSGDDESPGGNDSAGDGDGASGGDGDSASGGDGDSASGGDGDGDSASGGDGDSSGGDGDSASGGDGDSSGGGDGDSASGGDGDSSGDGSSASVDGWPMMGFDARNNYHNPNETTISVDNASSLTQKWAVTVAGTPTGTPIVAEGKVFVLANGVTALNLETGDEEWSVPAMMGTASLAYADGGIFVHTADANLYRLSAEDGSTEWGPVKTYDYMNSDGTSSPIVAGGKVFVGHSTSLEILGNATTQAEARGGIEAFDIATGERSWTHFTAESPENGAMIWSSVGSDGQAVYATTGNNYVTAGGNSDAMIAVDIESGADRLWTNQVREGDVWVLSAPMSDDTDFGANPIIADVDGMKLIAAGDKAAAFWVLDRETGQKIWDKQDLSPSHDPAHGGVLNNGAFDGTNFYVLSNDPAGNMAMLHAFNGPDGAAAWDSKTYPSNSWGMITVANGVLYVPVGDQLYVLDAATGDELTVIDPDAAGTVAGAGAPVVTDGKLVLALGLNYAFGGASAIPGNSIVCYGLP